jgi:hypothetical protein
MAIPFRLGTFSAADCARFGGFIVDERALAFNALDRFLLREQLDFHCDGALAREILNFVGTGR